MPILWRCGLVLVGSEYGHVMMDFVNRVMNILVGWKQRIYLQIGKLANFFKTNSGYIKVWDLFTSWWALNYLETDYNVFDISAQQSAYVKENCSCKKCWKSRSLHYRLLNFFSVSAVRVWCVTPLTANFKFYLMSCD